MKKILLKSILFCVMICCNANLQAQTTTNFQGTWMARGYGWVVEIDTETVHVYDLTKISCFASDEYPLTMFNGGLSISNNVLTMKRGVTAYTFDPISELPNICKEKLSKKELKNPLYNFDVLWNTFNEQYAYFKDRNVNWQQLRDTYRSRINDKTSKAELFSICDAMLEELNDGHVDISASDKVMKKAAIISNWDTRSNPDFKGARKAILSKYIKNQNRHNVNSTIWGEINDSIGYVQINSMGGQANFGIIDNTIPKNGRKLYEKYLASSPDTFVDELKGMNLTMQKVLNDFKDTKKIILDLRFNGGGEDMVGLAALSYFVNTYKTVFHKKNRVAESYSKPYSYELEAAENNYSGKLYILQSYYSASATEILLLSSMAYDNITRLGSPSEGIFSDILEKKLPNGWEFGLSNQVYQDNNGISYEAKGIPVHVDLNYPKDYNELVDKLKQDLKTSGDTAIEYILNN